MACSIVGNEHHFSSLPYILKPPSHFALSICRGRKWGSTNTWNWCNYRTVHILSYIKFLLLLGCVWIPCLPPLPPAEFMQPINTYHMLATSYLHSHVRFLSSLSLSLSLSSPGLFKVLNFTLGSLVRRLFRPSCCCCWCCLRALFKAILRRTRA